MNDNQKERSMTQRMYIVDNESWWLLLQRRLGHGLAKHLAGHKPIHADLALHRLALSFDAPRLRVHPLACPCEPAPLRHNTRFAHNVKAAVPDQTIQHDRLALGQASL